MTVLAANCHAREQPPPHPAARPFPGASWLDLGLAAGAPSLDTLVLSVFLIVYLGMILGELPGLAIDRTGVALLGAIAILGFERLDIADLGAAVDVPTIALLLGLMILSAQLRLSGFYTWVVHRVDAFDGSPRLLLAMVLAAAGVLSAVLANDIVCLAMTPVLIECCARRKLDPKPFLLGLACASNIGSAATLIGNPQNMLIGQVLRLSVLGYLRVAAVPSVFGLAATWVIIAWLTRGRWGRDTSIASVESPSFDRWQAAKGLTVAAALMAAFLLAPWPRELVALAGAGVLLCSRRMHSRDMLGLVDWQLLVLFIGLFVVNHAMRTSGNLDWLMAFVRSSGVRMEQPGWLFAVTVVLSNLVSNVPAVMLLLPFASHPLAGPILAIASTLAGNLLLVGSIANIIVFDQARRLEVHITWADHARVGIPVSIVTLAAAALWFWLKL
ncbi:MAG: anion transporter [Thermoguttaceae bacterium]